MGRELSRENPSLTRRQWESHRRSRFTAISAELPAGQNEQLADFRQYCENKGAGPTWNRTCPR